MDEESPPHRQSFDDELLRRATRDAGRWAFGTVVVETWVLNVERTFLVRVDSGCWVDPLIHLRCEGESCSFCRLTDPKHIKYTPAVPMPPGVGMAGGLWAETRSKSKAGRPSVVWRNIRALSQDPDRPYAPRLEIAYKLKLGWGAGVPFHANGREGIIIYMAREDIDKGELKSQTNERYLQAASNLIGAAYALGEPRVEALHERNQMLDAALRRARTKLLFLLALGLSLEDIAGKKQSEHPLSNQEKLGKVVDQLKDPSQVRQGITNKIISVAKKSKGGNVQPPPPFTYDQAVLTFIGVFVTLLALTRLNVHLEDTYGSEYTMTLGPFGALMTLLYGLTQAPASQPPNTIIGQAVSLTIALAVSYLNIQSWMQQSLATALAVAAMVKLGITHPPAGAACLIFSTGGSYSWTNMGMMLVGNVIAIVFATLVNNVSSVRQYPTFWGFGYGAKQVKKLTIKAKKQH